MDYALGRNSEHGRQAHAIVYNSKASSSAGANGKMEDVSFLICLIYLNFEFRDEQIFLQIYNYPIQILKLRKFVVEMIIYIIDSNSCVKWYHNNFVIVVFSKQQNYIFPKWYNSLIVIVGNNNW